MGFQLKEDEYYIIRQNIEGYIPNKYEIEYCDEETIIKLTRMLAGTVSVYIYNKKTNERIDKTNELGRKNRPLDEFRKITACSVFFKWNFDFNSWISIPIYNAIIYNDVLDYMRNNKAYLRLKYEDNIYRYLTIDKTEWTNIYSRKLIKKENTESNVIKGEAYEQFIGKKYEEKFKNVIYHGIEKKKKDNGIDLIVEDENKIIFVQCKNWINTEWNKLNQKDLRAFIGDCFLHITKNNITKKTSFHFIVSDENLLTDSAKIFIGRNNILKYKVIPFNKN